jgi:serine/threonine protein kinase
VDEPDAVENKILDSSYITDAKNHAVWAVVHELLPNIPHLYPTITGITLKTIGGKVTTTFAEDLDAIVGYLPIPLHLSHILTVPIAELQKVKGLDIDVDRVQWKGETYAFKKSGEALEGTLRELTILDKLSESPHILDLKAIVVNRDNTIRGFLSPFFDAGDLVNVFCTAREKQGLTDYADATVFDWPLKLSWACQITYGVVQLHSISAYNGDLKPKNVLVSSEGRAILIDFLPMGISEPFAAPEVWGKCHDGVTEFQSVLTAPADVYSLGLLLHMVAEEKLRDIHPIVWRDGRSCTWYREIVESCLVLDPKARPSAAEVLSLLEKGGRH